MSSSGPQDNTPQQRQRHNCPRNSLSSPMLALLTPIKKPPQQLQHPQQVLTRGDIATQTDQAEAAATEAHQQEQQPQATTNWTPQQQKDQSKVEPSKREPNVVDQLQQMTPQQNGQTLRLVKSSPHLPKTSQEIQRELHNALVPPNPQQQNDAVGLGQGDQMRRSRSVIFDWLAYDSPQSLNRTDETDNPGQQEIAADQSGTDINPDEQQNGMLDQLGPIASLSTIIDFERMCTKVGNTLDWLWTSFVQLWQYRLFRFAFVLLSVYYGLGFLERWAVTMTAACVRWMWPPVHFLLGSSRGSLFYLTDWFAWMEDFLSSWVCDMANRYCQQYDVMCDCQCSFVGRTQRAAFFGRRF